ncbi:MAG: mechanosensitive ion channel family protein [Peptostreptococcaceae bacterium]|jgi:small-conductance mechanosensitive channel|nr:mechanosensitive ion channel family protein [Peptostreptococcaceae bacterium]
MLENLNYLDLNSSNVPIKEILGIIIILFIISLIRKSIIKLIWKFTDDVKKRYYFRKIITYFMAFLSILLIWSIFYSKIESFATFFGLLSAGITIALKDLIINMAAFMFIIFRKPFSIEDRIEIGNFKGDVIDIRVFQFTLMEIENWVGAEQSTGRVIEVPNGYIFSHALFNYSKGFDYIWNEVPVLITLDSDWKRAKMILKEISKVHCEHIEQHTQKNIRNSDHKYMIFYSNLTPIVYMKAESSGILLTLRYLCKPKHRRNTENNIWEVILEEFKKNNVELAYESLTVYKK